MLLPYNLLQETIIGQNLSKNAKQHLSNKNFSLILEQFDTYSSPRKEDLYFFNQIHKKTHHHRSQIGTTKLYSQFDVLRSTTEELYLKKYLCSSVPQWTCSSVPQSICSPVPRLTCSPVTLPTCSPVTWPLCSPVLQPTCSPLT